MIHYHGTPMGGKRDYVARWMIGRHVLIPFLRPEDLPCAASYASSFIFDNSAFTAWKSGHSIDWEKYFKWVDQWRLHPGFDWAIIPDQVDGSEKDNDALLAKWYRHFLPTHTTGVPVWHLHESFDRLKYLAEHHHRVALGSSGSWPNPGTESWWSRMSEAMDYICDEEGRPPCKLHGLRMMNPEIFSRLPLASADSTNVAQNSDLTSKFGNYCPPTRSQRMSVISSRIESSNSACCWKREEMKQVYMFETQ